MPPKKIDKQSLKYLKFGNVLLDENRKVIFLCDYCTEFTEIGNFVEHLKKCRRVGHIFKPPSASKLNCDTDETELLKIVKTNAKELLIYGFSGQTDEHLNKNGDMTNVLSIEEELLDPKWYADASTSVANVKNTVSYNELIEQVTPFVHFKENVKTNTSTRASRTKECETLPKPKLQVVNKLETKMKQTSTKVLRSSAVAEKSKSLDNTKKPNQQQVTVASAQKNKNPPEKPVLKTPTKIIVVDVNSQQNTQKGGIKRKNDSLPNPPAAKISPSQNESEIKKRRKTSAIDIRQNIEIRGKTSSAENVNVKEPAKGNVATTIKNKHINSTGAALPIQEKKQETRNLNLKNSVSFRRGRSEIQRPATEQKTIVETNCNQIKQQNVNSNLKISTKSAFSTQIEDQSQAVAVPAPTAIKLKAMSSSQSAPSATSATVATTSTSHISEKNQKTAEIINKLQTLGLKVQRTNPQPEVSQQISSTASKSNEKALEIIKKLQSKGMNVKIVQKPKLTTTIKPPPAAFTTIHSPTPSMGINRGNAIIGNSGFSSTKRNNSTNNNDVASKGNFRKNYN